MTVLFATMLFLTVVVATLDATTAVMAVLDATTTDIAVLDAAVAVMSATRAASFIFDSGSATKAADFGFVSTAVMADGDSHAALIAVTLVVMRLVCPRSPRSPFSSVSRPGSVVSKDSSCAPDVVPAVIALSILIALIVGMVRVLYDLMTVMGHAVRTAVFVVADVAVELVSITVTVFAALTQAW